MGRLVLNVAWQGTLTVHGMALSAPDTFPWLRGTEYILTHSYHVVFYKLPDTLYTATNWRFKTLSLYFLSLAQMQYNTSNQ